MVTLPNWSYKTDVIGNIFKHGINFSQYNWKKTTNAWKIDIGMFKGDLGQIINKWTWNLHNSIIGNTAAHIWNLSGNVDGVTEMDGMLALSGATGKGKAFTIGHYSFGPENYKADWRDHLFVHEYGHYIQSQYLGPLYLNVVGLPSLASTAFVKKLTGIEHGNRWFETWANDLGARYFDKKYGENSYYHRKNNQYFDYYAFKNGIPTDYVNPRTGKINSGKGYSSTSPTFTLWDFAFL